MFPFRVIVGRGRELSRYQADTKQRSSTRDVHEHGQNSGDYLRSKWQFLMKLRFEVPERLSQAETSASHVPRCTALQEREPTDFVKRLVRGLGHLFALGRAQRNVITLQFSI